MMDEELLRRLRDLEDGFTERKSEGAANGNELRKTLVAFSNSVPEGEKAILFIGVKDDGTIVGMGNSDSTQKSIRKVAEKECFPPIKYQTRVLKENNKTILAVLIEASSERPHFSGHAYIRKGSESVSASEQVYEELIASRNTKAGRILSHKGKLISFRLFELDSWGRKRTVSTISCKIEKCDAHFVSLKDISTDRYFSIPMEDLMISFDQEHSRLLIESSYQ